MQSRNNFHSSNPFRSEKKLTFHPNYALAESHPALMSQLLMEAEETEAEETETVAVVPAVLMGPV